MADVEVMVVLCAPDRPISGMIPVWQHTMLDWAFGAELGRCVCSRVFKTSNGVTTRGISNKFSKEVEPTYSVDWS